MPFTPLHMGPGMLAKALLQSSFSLMIFGWTQIVMDLQPLIAIVRGQGVLHGWTHSYAGALVIAAVASFTGKGLIEFGLKYLVRLRSLFHIHTPLTGWVCMSSALIGSLSHVLLDSVMHFDLQPFYPWRAANPFLYQLSIAGLHLLCVLSGVLGLLGYGAQRYRRRNTR